MAGCASASFTFKPLQHLYPFSYCKYTSMLKYPFKISPSTKLTLEVESHFTRLETDQEISRVIPRSVNSSESGSGLSSFSPKVSRVSRKHSKNNHTVGNVKRVILKEGHVLNSGKRRELSSEISIAKSNNGSSGKKDEKSRRVENAEKKVLLKEGHGLNSGKRRELASEISIVKSNNGSSGKKDEKSRMVENAEKKVTLKEGHGLNSGKRRELASEISIAKSNNGSSGKKDENRRRVENAEKKVTFKEGHGLSSGKRRELASEISIAKSNNESSGKKDEKTRRVEQKSRKNEMGIEQKEKGSSRGNKVHSPAATLRLGLDMCSKRGDFSGAIRLYELARKEGVKMGQYHYSVLLYLCSSAAAGFLQPAKSGSGSRSLNLLESKEVSSPQFEHNTEFSQMENRKRVVGENGLTVDSLLENQSYVNSLASKITQHNSDSTLDELVQVMKNIVKPFEVKDERDQQESYIIQVGEDVKSFALQKGFEICEMMKSEKVPMNEATLTSMARLAMSLGDGDMAFGVVKQMKESGIDPRLRSYGPALTVFCNSGDVEKAFMVEGHMLENGVYPEEPELEALLKVSVEAKRSDKVYYLLHKLRTSVRQVSPYTADLIEKWFHSTAASRAGKIKWDQRLIRKAIENGGGGWHGQGWLGNGKWTVLRTSVGSDGFCKCCGEQLATIDLDPEETENFAKSVASIAAQREKHLNFQKFQKWLDDHGPFEAVVDGANVGLFSQGKFQPYKINAIANGIRQMLPYKRWPLIILHNKRTCDMMRKPFNQALVQKWKTADALYETPTGSNDDWYWLYAAIKFRCLLVTNDEMRDHLFQLLGNDFFPKWKERHQVHFGFSEIGPEFHMPPPYSVVIQESENGHWHIPIASELGSERDRTWLCVTRTNPHTTEKNSPNVSKESEVPRHKEKDANSSTLKKTRTEVTRRKHGNNSVPQEMYADRKGALQSSISPNHPMMLQELEAAETLGGCIIDFQI